MSVEETVRYVIQVQGSGDSEDNWLDEFSSSEREKLSLIRHLRLQQKNYPELKFRLIEVRSIVTSTVLDDTYIKIPELVDTGVPVYSEDLEILGDRFSVLKEIVEHEREILKRLSKDD